jgi:pre-mRNA-splicing factor 38A
MANRTQQQTGEVHGYNPQFLISRIIRDKVYDNRYWKETCFALNAETIVDVGADMKYIGGTYGGFNKPTPFLCVFLKLLQIGPDKEVILEYIRQDDFKYLRALGAWYFRFIGIGKEIYQALEPLLADYRKLRVRTVDGKFDLMTMDEMADQLLTQETMFHIGMPQLIGRAVLEDAGELDERVCDLVDDLGEVDIGAGEVDVSDDEPSEPEAKRPRRDPDNDREPRVVPKSEIREDRDDRRPRSAPRSAISEIL